MAARASGPASCRGARRPRSARSRRRRRSGSSEREARARPAARRGEASREQLLAHLLDYHRREEKPQWWAYFNNLTLDEEELIESSETIGGLELVGEPERDGQSLVYTLEFPPQEHKIGGAAVDPGDRAALRRARSTTSTASSRSGAACKRVDEPLPRALIPAGRSTPACSATRCCGSRRTRERYPALVEILERRPPRALPLRPGPAGLGQDVHRRARGGRADEGRAARRRHRAQPQGDQQVPGGGRERRLRVPRPEEVERGGHGVRGPVHRQLRATTRDLLDPELQLIAGTSFLFARPEFDQHVDTLFVDEGGQMALADALAVGTAARELILLGDPNQLPQVSQGSHPPGASASVLGHLLGDDETVRPGMGEFLEQTWRMRPEVNAFISETFYEGRLEPATVCFERSVALGNGLRFVEVEHEGHRAASVEEADVRARRDRAPARDAVRRRARRARAAATRTSSSSRRTTRRCAACATAIPDQRVRIGTVDKFQGQEAPVVFYSMASSSGDDVPRGLDFLFSRNRLNVAISRAKCLAYLVASPRLLDANCRTVEQMRLANALCRFVEAERPQLVPDSDGSPVDVFGRTGKAHSRPVCDSMGAPGGRGCVENIV